MSRTRGRRYNEEAKLNYKKVFAVIIAIVVIIMFFIIIKKLLTDGDEITYKGTREYAVVYSENKWGIIDSSGNIVIPPAYQEMLIVPNSKKDVFLCIYDVNDETGEYKTKALNSENEEIFKEYEQIEGLENIDKYENIYYEEGLLKVKQNGKYGLIDLEGKQILPCEYENIEEIAGVEDSIIVTQNGKKGLIDNTGKTIIETNYKEIKKMSNDYKDGYITVSEDGKYGIVGFNQKVILENNYEYIEPIVGTENFVIKQGDKQKLINTQGEIVLEGEEYDTISQILSYSTKGIVYVKNGLYGVMGLDKVIKIEPKYQYLEEVKDEIYIAKKDNNYGIIDLKENERIGFKYENITYSKIADVFIAENKEYNSDIIDSSYNVKLSGILSSFNTDEGYLKIRIDNEYKYYNFKFEEKKTSEIYPSNTLYLSKKDGKYGFVGKNGEVIVDYIYDEAQEQNEYGYAAVKQGNLWGAIDSKGNVVVTPKYTLEDNLIIDFIGKWHLGEDLNMNYYCEK